MIINHNISALNSLNRLNKNNKNTTVAMEKLSSGLRISKASDDSAGLAISEKMRSQIRGLGQAQKNIQDGISLIQTAESALSTIQEPNLLRLRELAIQAANDTLTSDDRQETQKEVVQIKQGINEIANNTHFNNIKLLNRTVESTQITQEPGYNWESFDTGFSGYIAGVDKIGERYIGVGEDGNILSSVDGKGWNVVNVGTPYNFYEVISNGSQLVAIGDRGNLYTTDDGINWSKQNFPTDGVWNPSQLQLHNGIWDGNEYRIAADRGYILSSSDGINWSYAVSTENTQYQDIAFNGTQYVVVGNMGKVATSDDGVTWTSQNSNTTNALHSIEWINGKFISVGENGTMISSIDGSTWSVESSLDSLRLNTLATNDQSIIVGGWDGPSKENLFISADGQNWTNLDAISNSQILDIEFLENSNEFIASTFDGKFLHSTAIYTTNSALEKINLQIGTNGGDAFSIELTDARTKALGIDNIDLSTRQGAESALSKIDNAMEKVSSERGKYGAYQNALEHVHNNVSNYELNLTASESRIRDTDMAKQMMALIKNQILSQASQPMLSRASQQPQQVLQLLK
jgi:flagellin